MVHRGCAGIMYIGCVVDGSGEVIETLNVTQRHLYVTLRMAVSIPAFSYGVAAAPCLVCLRRFVLALY